MLKVISTPRSERIEKLKAKLPAMQEYVDNGGTMTELFKVVEDSFGPLTSEERTVIFAGVRPKGIELEITL